MNKKITDALNALRDQLTSVGSSIPTLLSDGLQGSAIDAMIRGQGLDLPEEVYTLFGWSNGVKDEYLESLTLGQMFFFDVGIFLPFDYLLEHYNYYGRDHGYWPAHLFPIFGSTGGDFYLIDFSNTAGSQRQIFLYSSSNYEFEGHISIYDSLTQLIVTVTECYRQGAYFYTFEDRSAMNIHPDKAYEISKSLNPGSDYWRLISSG